MTALCAALTELREAHALVRAASETLDRAETALDTAAEDAVQHRLQRPVKDLPPPCEYRRQHRPGRPAKIDADAELRAFILARIDTLTFPQFEAEVAETFPPARRVSKSTIHAWWAKNRKGQSSKSHPR